VGLLSRVPAGGIERNLAKEIIFAYFESDGDVMSLNVHA
jgi:hypothetical protein